MFFAFAGGGTGVSDYQVWSEQPAVWVLSAVISLVFTLLLYGTFPIVFSKTRKDGITKKRYRGYCICAVVVIYICLMMVYAALEVEGAPGMIPAVLWTGVFYKAGLSSLEKRGKILASVPQKAPQPEKKQEPVPAHQGTASAVQGDMREQGSLTVDREAGKFFNETTDAGRGTGGGTARFCRNCGCELIPDSKFCSVCGTEIVREW